MTLAYTLFPPQLDWPADWVAIYGRRSAPLTIEIGFGNGQFLLDLAERQPQHNLLGLEISLPSLRKAERRLARASFDHVRLLQGTAQMVLWTLCRPESLAALYINFPDPWPKESHHQRRLINDRFLHLAATRLPAGATIDIATDHPDYAAWITACLERTPYFSSRLATTFVTEDKHRLRTKYELKALAEGRTCHYYKWQRNGTAVVNDFPIPQEQPMPHALVQTPLSLSQIAEQFDGQQWRADPITVRLIELFTVQGRDALLFDTYVAEEPLTQRVMLAITQRGSDQYLLHLHEIGYPRPTSGLHQAIHWLAEWLITLHPEGQLLRHNLRLDAPSKDSGN